MLLAKAPTRSLELARCVVHVERLTLELDWYVNRLVDEIGESLGAQGSLDSLRFFVHGVNLCKTKRVHVYECFFFMKISMKRKHGMKLNNGVHCLFVHCD